MSRGMGSIYKPVVRGEAISIWWLDYSINGKRFRESSGTDVKSEAARVLRQKVGDREQGKLVGNPQKVLLKQLRELHEKSYDIGRLRSKVRIQNAWKHLDAFFGKETRVVNISSLRLDDYYQMRIKEQAQPQTVGIEIACLRRSFKLAIEKQLLSVMPTFRMPRIQNARQGFFSTGELAALLLELSEPTRDLVEFLACVGWRRDEARLLTWNAVDRSGEVIRLEESRSKNGEPRIFPYAKYPQLKSLIERRWQARDGTFVFHSKGQELDRQRINAAWKGACKRCGLEGKLIHDLRRSFARNMRRLGVSESVIMALAGWRTTSMFLRYNIVDEVDLAEAISKVANVTANIPL